MPTFDWIGKKAVVNHHLEVPYRLIHCNGALSAGDPNAGNLLIEGDNLVALKALLPYYAGKVKCIYIDPPYNTGNENWVYNDNVNSPEIQKWLGETVGKEAEDLSRHDKWLCMMYPRLRLLREFLREDGIIFVSIDDYEIHRLRMLMDEVFGTNNLVHEIVWKNKYGPGAMTRGFGSVHEYILCYSRKPVETVEAELSDEEAAQYTRKDEKFALRGGFITQPLMTRSKDERQNLIYPVAYKGETIWPDKQWIWEEARLKAAIKNDEVVFRKSKGKWSVRFKQYLNDPDGKRRKSKPISIFDGPFNQDGTWEIEEIFGNKDAFPNPKPSTLISKLVSMIINGDESKDGIFLDSFAGSASTGHALLRLNKTDGGNRRFVLVEMESRVAKQIAAERLRRVSEGYKTTNSTVAGLGGGFRYCALGEPLFDSDGGITPTVTFPDLGAHVFFAETGQPIPKKARDGDPFLGIFQNRAVYLLWSREGASKPSSHKANILTTETLSALSPPAAGFSGESIVYADGCTVSRERLMRDKIVFKQVPYRVAGN